MIQKIIILPFLIILTLLGIFVLGLQANNFLNGIDSNRWPTTQGRILYSFTTIGGTAKPGSRVIHHTFMYEYSVEGRQFRNQDISCCGIISKNFLVKKITAEYPSGKDVIVYYDPNKPRKSFLQPGIPLFSTLLDLLVTGLLLVFLLFGYWAVFKKR